ncbi:autotransporter outer membrane beta-barrel domain-containing protein [Pelistega suis]|uniref:autotransporter outer membrane beta-barrel domain-containing protein n=1 Tax=Pelistega suis TaxID=1631957 RepID=UPI00211CF8E7|nr:autotransporter outer membrane beta-barrel domain-containing protein [Pelistega suis]MCQ9329325.1 autotransporter outer membrane beta-barrel domain-containing protein [Pelistega suis]
MSASVPCKTFLLKPLSIVLMLSGIFSSANVLAACTGNSAYNNVASGGSVCNYGGTSYYGANVVRVEGAGTVVNFTNPELVEIATTNGASTHTVGIYNGGTATGASIFFERANIFGTTGRVGRTIRMEGVLTDPTARNLIQANGLLQLIHRSSQGAALDLEGSSQLLRAQSGLNIWTGAAGVRNSGTIDVVGNMLVRGSNIWDIYSLIGNSGDISVSGNLSLVSAPDAAPKYALETSGGTITVGGLTHIRGNTTADGANMRGILLSGAASPVVRLNDLIANIAKNSAFAIEVKAGSLMSAAGSTTAINTTGNASHAIVVRTSQNDDGTLNEKGGRVSLGAEIVEDTHVLLAGNTTVTTSGAGSHAVIIRTTGADEVAKFAQDANASITTTGENSHALVITSDKGIDTTTGNMTAGGQGLIFNTAADTQLKTVAGTTITSKGTSIDLSNATGVNTGIIGESTIKSTDGLLLQGGAGKENYTFEGSTLTGNIDTADNEDSLTFNQPSTSLTGDIFVGAGNDVLTLSNTPRINSNILDGGADNDILNLNNHYLEGSSEDGKTGTLIKSWETINLNPATLRLTGNLSTNQLNLYPGSTLDLSDGVQSATVMGNVLNQGTIDLTRNAAPTDSLVITGNYEGSRGGELLVNTNWNATGNEQGANSQTDSLIIQGSASGKTAVSAWKDQEEGIITGSVVRVRNLVQNTVPVVQALQGADVGAFYGTASTENAEEAYLTSRLLADGSREFFWTLDALEEPPVTPVEPPVTPVEPPVEPPVTPVEPPVTPVDPTPSVPVVPAKPAYHSAVPSYVQTPRLGMELGLASLASLHERRGSEPLSGWADEARNPTWARMYGKRLSLDGKVRFDADTDYFGLQIGHDWSKGINQSGTHYATGGYISFSEANHKFYDQYRVNPLTGFIDANDKNTGHGRTTMWSFGLTHTRHYKSGLYTDYVAQFSHLKNRYVARDGVTAHNHGWSLAASAELGKRFVLSQHASGADKWMLEPQVQLVYAHQELNSFKDSKGRAVQQKDSDILRARMGLKLRYSGDKSPDNASNSAYVIANVYKDFIQPSSVYIGQSKLRERYNSLWGEIGIGAQLSVNKQSYIYADIRYEKNLNGTNRHAYKANAGVQFRY